MHATPKITKRVKELAKDAFDAHGMVKSEYVDYGKTGCYRSVYVENGIAYKLSREDDAIHTNRQEWETWQTLPESVRKVTAKPLAISNCGRVIAFECIPETVSQWGERTDNFYTWRDDLRAFNRNLKRLLEENGFSRDEIMALLDDNHGNNVGVRENGDLVWIDFASPHGGYSRRAYEMMGEDRDFF